MNINNIIITNSMPVFYFDGANQIRQQSSSDQYFQPSL